MQKPRETPRGTSYRGDNKNNPHCYACSEIGHTTRDCPAVKDAIERRRKDKDRAASTSSVRALHMLPMLTDHNTTTENNNPKLRFLIDSGTMQHMTPYEEILQDITASSKQILTAGNHTLDAIGEGDTIIMNDLQLMNVLLAPDLHDSLLSVVTMNDHGYDITFNHDGVVSIRDKNDIIAEGY